MTTQAEPAFFGTPEEAALRARGQVFSSVPEIGAATGIEFLPGGLVRAAAEPVRRGGGSAMVEHPLPEGTRARRAKERLGPDLLAALMLLL